MSRCKLPWVGGGRHVKPFIRCGEENPEPASVKAETRRPHAASGLDFFVGVARDIFERMIHQSPVDQIPRVKNWHARRAIEGRRGHPEIITVPKHIRVAVIGIEYGVPIRAVAAIGHPGIRLVPGARSWVGLKSLHV